MIARRILVLMSAVLLAVSLGGCATGDKQDNLGHLLPSDTLLWLHLEDLSALEPALEASGLLDLMVAELDKAETRDELREKLGLELAADPREDVHALMQDLHRADLSIHPPLHEGAEDPVLLVHLECADEPAAERVLAMVQRQGGETRDMAGIPALVLDAEDEVQLFVGRSGAHLIMASEGERWGEAMAALLDPPASGLMDTPAFARVSDGQTHQVTVYITPEFQSEFRGFGPTPPGFDPSSMGPLMEKYGSQYGYLGADYLLTRIISRQALTEDSALAPLYESPAGPSALQAWLPAGTFLYEGVLVHEGRAKMELIQQFVVDMMAAAAEASGQTLAPMQRDPFGAAEGLLGFSLPDLAALLEEWAVVGGDGLGYALLLRAHDEAGAAQIEDMFATSPALAMMAEGEPLTAGDVALRSYVWPMDPEGRSNVLGHRGDTVMLVFMAEDTETLLAFAAGTGEGSLADTAPEHGRRQLTARGCGWGYLDLGAMLASLEIDVDDKMAELPPALAQRLRSLQVAGHMDMPGGGISEVVIEAGRP